MRPGAPGRVPGVQGVLEALGGLLRLAHEAHELGFNVDTATAGTGKAEALAGTEPHGAALHVGAVDGFGFS